MRIFRQLALAFLCLILPASASASPLMDAYKDYQDAMEKGDWPVADAAGETAWKFAEDANNEKYIAILAYNLAELRLQHEPEKDALTPAKRAAGLADKTEGALPSEKTGLLVAVLERMKAPTAQNTDTLSAALTAFSNTNVPPDVASFVAYEQMQAYALDKERWENALEAGKQAISIYQSAQLNNPDLLTDIYLSNGIALVKMAQWQSSNRQLYTGQALQYFDTVVKQLAPMDFKNIPQTYLIEEAWRAFADIMHKKPKGKVPMPEFRKNAISRPDSCPEFEFNRKPPRYPARAAERGLSGGVSVVYDLDENGTTTNIRIGASTTGKAFDRTVRKWVQTTRARNIKGQDVPLACRANWVTYVGFSLSD